MNNIVVKQLNKYKYIICSLLLVGVLICINVFINKKQVYETVSFYGIEEITSQALGTSNDEQLRSILNGNSAFGLIKLKDGDKISQDFSVNTLSVEELYLTFEAEGSGGVVEVTLTDESGKKIYKETLSVTPESSRFVLDINNNHNAKYDKYNLKLKVNCNSDGKLSIYDCTYHDGSLKINGKVNENVILTGTKGLNGSYNSKKILALTIIFIILLLAMLTFSYLEKGIVRKIDRVIDNLHKVWIFIWEWLSFLGLLYVFLQVFTSWYYEEKINMVTLILFVIILTLFLFILGLLFVKMKNNIADIFVLLCIPIGLCFVFLILPGHVPDEPVHFAKAYLTSQFDFSYTRDFKITSQYYEITIKNYNGIIPAIFTTDNYQSLMLCQDACAYHFILYLASSIPLLITRLLGLSIYLGFYGGRMVNLMIFIIVGYNIIKMVPFGKWIFFVYFFNPMLLQQSMSFSADSIINSTCLLAIAYFLKLRFSEDKIRNKDIIVVFTLIGITLLSKYVYLPIYGIYFLLFDKLLKMDARQWGLCLIFIILIGLAYYGTTLLQANAQALESLDNYVKENNVNQSEQINFLLSNPGNIVNVFIETFQDKKYFYFNSFIGMLGIIAIPLNVTSYFGYYGLMIATPLIFEKTGEHKVKWFTRLWFIFISIVVICLVILGLYLQWTPVGTLVTEGVQGRYFIPAVILFLLAIIVNKKHEIKYTNVIIPIYLLIVEFLVFIDIINYFI